MAAPVMQHLYTEEEYLAYERQAETKHEYIAGRIVAMTGGSLPHVLINKNIVRTLDAQTLNSPCVTYSNDMRVKISAKRIYTYPDITVVCGEQQFEETRLATLLNPTVLIEVLSPSTEAYDRGAKFHYYQTLSSLREYLLVSQDQVLVEHYTRTGQLWSYEAITDPVAVLSLSSVDCTLAIADVYKDVSFETEVDPKQNRLEDDPNN